MAVLTQLNVSWVEHERFSVITFIGASLVFTGAILVARRTKKNKT
jgi:LPXTG-motif cell wall-anchored protein